MAWLAVVIAVILIFMSPKIISEWRGTVEFEPKPQPRWWPFGDELWRGWERAHLLNLGVAALVVAGTVLLLLTPASGAGGPPRPAFLAVVVAAALLFAAFCSCVLFNRPRWLAPASMRGDAGAVPVWLERDREHGGLFVYIALTIALVFAIAAPIAWFTVSVGLGGGLLTGAVLIVGGVGRELSE